MLAAPASVSIGGGGQEPNSVFAMDQVAHEFDPLPWQPHRQAEARTTTTASTTTTHTKRSTRSQQQTADYARLRAKFGRYQFSDSSVPHSLSRAELAKLLEESAQHERTKGHGKFEQLTPVHFI
jgi:hypothetical protein